MKKAILLCLILTLLLTGCDSAGEPPSYAPKEEEKLVIYTSHKEEVYQPIVREFERRTGVWVEVVYGGTNELLEKIRSETDNPKADVMFGGGVESLNSCSDCFQSYEAADSQAIRPLFSAAERTWTPFSALPVVLIYNTKLVSPETLTVWQDLTRPEFKGKIAFADPSVSGSSFTALVTWLSVSRGSQAEKLEEFAEALDGRQLEGSGEVITSVADGACLVGVTLEESAVKHIASGMDIALVYPKDGTSCVPDGSALIAGAPHEENAKRFLDFTVSKDVQKLLPQRFSRRSVREDVEPGDSLIPLSDIPLIDYDLAWASENQAKLLSDWDFQRKEDSQ